MKFILPVFSTVLFSLSTNAQVQILNEDFSTGIPSSWTVHKVDANVVDSSVIEFAPGWIGLTDPQDPTNEIAGATSYFTTPATANRFLVTPPVQLGDFGNILKWRARSHDPSFAEDYMVVISTTNSDPASFSDTLYGVFLEMEDWTEHEVNISELGYNSQNVYIAFVLKSFDGFKLYLDDVNIRKEDPVSVSENFASNISVYPNPAINSFSIKGTSGYLKLISLTGTVVLEKEVLENEKTDISFLNAGTYIAEISSDSGVFRTRIVKQ